MVRSFCKYFAWSSFFSLSTLLIFLACTSTKKDTAQDELNEEEQKKLDEYRAEIEVGRNMAGRLLQFYGNHDDETLLSYVNQVGTYVGKFGVSDERRYMFDILDSEMVNAFACPGGYILVTMGAIRHAANEAELAAILGHETAHVAKRHMLNRIKNMSDEELQKANEIAKEKLKLPETVTVRERPTPEDSQVGDVLAKYLAGGASGLSVIKAAGAGMSVMLEQGLGAEKEYEADAEGVTYAVNAGYDPDALVHYLCRLEAKKLGKKKMDCTPEAFAKVKKKKKSESILDKTHPAVKDRIANIRKTLQGIDSSTIVGATGTKRFQRFQARLPKSKATEAR